MPTTSKAPVGMVMGTSRRGRGALRTAVSVYGVLVGLAGAEHGIGALLQGPVAAGGLTFESWPDSRAFELVSGEPAMTVLPDLRSTGVLAIVVGLSVAIWSVRLPAGQGAGIVLIGLSVLLLLFGGGFAPPLMGVALGLAALRIDAPARRPPPAVLRRLGRRWTWFVAAGLLGYLGLVPGTLVLTTLTSSNGEPLVLALVVLAFSGFFLSLALARAHDRAIGWPGQARTGDP